VRLDRQQRLVLLGCDAVLARAFLAEGQEIADGAAEIAKRLVVDGLERGRSGRGAGGRGVPIFRGLVRFQA
jgi:hypothetical protein